jgi:hypothetical protein
MMNSDLDVAGVTNPSFHMEQIYTVSKGDFAGMGCLIGWQKKRQTEGGYMERNDADRQAWDVDFPIMSCLE